MATTVLTRATELAKQRMPGEGVDAAYARLCGGDCRPCDFRRWWTQCLDGKSSAEAAPEMVAQIHEMQSEGLTVDEAFEVVSPEFVPPGVFQTAVLNLERVSKHSVVVEEPEVESVPEETVEDSE